MANKFKTNEDFLKALLKDLTTIEAALLRERIQKISVLTRQDISKDSTAYNTPFTTANDWLRLCDKIDKHLNEPK